MITNDAASSCDWR